MNRPLRSSPSNRAGTRRASRAASRKGWRGIVTVEFALVAPLLLLIVFMTIDMGVALWVNLTMQYAVREGARYSVTGQSNLDPNASNQQRYQAVLAAIRGSSMGLYDMVSPSYTITVNGAKSSYTSTSSYSTGMFGGPGDIVVLQINCAWKMMTPLVQPFFPNGLYSFSVATTMRNEGF